MSPATTRLLIELIAIPLLKELARRRGVQGVTEKNLKAFVESDDIMINLKDNKPLNNKVIDAFADAIDNIASEAVDAIAWIFGANTPGGTESEESSDTKHSGESSGD